ncbi:MAG: ATP-grasp domain-containing protein [Rhizonema sp. PD37]|nr:ATP-grasp domain-containing protein [Rhizonema sp. PD37]
MTISWLAFIESNTSGTGRLFARTAVQMGFRPILLTSNPSLYKYVQEDKLDILQVDTQDEQVLLKVCQQLAIEQQLVGITSSSEYYVASAASIAKPLGLPSPNPSAIQACRNKQTQRSRLKQAGINVPAFCSATSVEDAVTAAKSLGFPVVIKPVYGSGSFGVKLCSLVDEVVTHATYLLEQKQNERGLPLLSNILVEKLAIGPEYSVETFNQSIIGITEKHLGALPYFVEVGHDFPAPLKEAETQSIYQTIFKTLDVLDLGWGAAHVELRLTTEGPVIIEVNPRLAGGYIPELVRLSYGIDLISETIRQVVGIQPLLKKTMAGYTSIRFILPPVEGTIVEVNELETAQQIPGIIEARLYSKIGDCVYRQGNFRDRIGHVIASSNTLQATREVVNLAHNTIQLRYL